MRTIELQRRTLYIICARPWLQHTYGVEARGKVFEPYLIRYSFSRLHGCRSPESLNSASALVGVVGITIPSQTRLARQRVHARILRERGLRSAAFAVNNHMYLLNRSPFDHHTVATAPQRGINEIDCSACAQSLLNNTPSGPI